MINRVVLVGRTTREVEVRYTNSGTAVGSFGIAVERNRTNARGEKETDFFDVVVWGKLAEICGQHLAKGREAAIDGRLQTRTYENREGHKVKVVEVVADSVQFIGSRGDSNGGQVSRQPSQQSESQYAEDPFADDGDLPF